MDTTIAARFDLIRREAHAEAVAAIALALAHPENEGAARHAKKADVAADDVGVSWRCAADWHSERSPEEHLQDAEEALESARYHRREAMLALLPY